MQKGTVKWFNNQKGYGFITEDSDGRDFFIHQSNIIMDGFRHLNENDIVEFDIGTSEDGREQAVNVKPILTMGMIEDSLREEDLHVETMKDAYGVTVYMVADQNNVIQTEEKGMSFLDLAAYAGFEIVEQSA